jgi:ATP-dependent Clp protease ATP-binding subunit ClpC
MEMPLMEMPLMEMPLMEMPRRPYLTTRAHEAFALAHDLADRRGDEALTPAHLALGLLREGRGLVAHVLHVRGVSVDALARELEAGLPAPRRPRPAPAERHWTDEDERFVAQAMREARELGTEYYGTEHLLLALARDPAGAPAQALARQGVGFADVRAEVLRVLRPEPGAPGAAPPG